MYVCMCVCVHARLHACMRACVHVFMHFSGHHYNNCVLQGIELNSHNTFCAPLICLYIQHYHIESDTQYIQISELLESHD